MRALALTALLARAAGLWSTLGRDGFRTSALAGALPGRAGAAGVLLDVLDAGAAYAGASPVASAETLAAVSRGGCNVTFFSLRARVPALDGWWSPCAAGAPPVAADASLAGAGGALWLGVTADGAAVGLAMAPGAARAPLFAARLPLSPAAGPLVRNCTATWVDAGGAVAVTELGPWCDARAAAGAQPPVTTVLDSSARAAGAGDGFPHAATAAPGGGFLVTSRLGAVTAFDARGALEWAAALPLGGGAAAAGAVADAPAEQAYVLGDGGAVCCLSLARAAAGGNCSGWGGAACVALPGAALPLRGGLALSPKTAGFHGGELYAADAVGALFVVSTASGDAGSSAAGGKFAGAGSPARAAPALVAGAWGAGKNGAVVVSAGGAPGGGARATVVALAVGSNGAGRDDDDAVDDDGYATVGAMWQVALPAGAAAAGAVAVVDDGRVVVPTSAGLAVLSARAAAAPAAASEALIEGLAFGAVGAAVAALAVSLACVARQRRRRAARLAEEAAEEAAEAGFAASGAGGDGAYAELDEAAEKGGAAAARAAALADAVDAPAPRRIFALNALVN